VLLALGIVITLITSPVFIPVDYCHVVYMSYNNRPLALFSSNATDTA